MIAAAGAATGQPRPRVSAFSETGALLIAAGHVEIAMRLEAIADELVARDLPTLELTAFIPCCRLHATPRSHGSVRRTH